MKDQKGDKSVEITVLVELFSTFFEKIIFVHPDKDILIKNLAKFKNFLYGNQQNLEKGYEFLQTMKEQYSQYLSENQQGIANNQATTTAATTTYQNNQLGEQQPQLHSPPQQSFQQYQQQHNQQRQSEQQALSKQYGQSSSQASNSNNQLHGQTGIKAFKFDLSKLNESANLFKIQSIQDFTGVRGEGINPKIALSGSGYSHIREFVSEVNAFYRCIGFRYFEQLLKNQNISKLQDVLKSVQTKKVQLDQYYREGTENDPEENDARECNRDNLRQTFCGYIEYLVENLAASIAKKDRSAQSTSATISTTVDLQEILYKIVNGDSLFDTALISYVKEQTVRFIQESDPLYIAFLLQNQELKNEKELIQHIRSQNDPQEIAMKIVASGIETQINIYTIENDNSLTQKILKFNSLPESSKNSLDLLKIKSPYVIYYLIYNQQEGQSLARASSTIQIAQPQSYHSSFQQPNLQQQNISSQPQQQLQQETQQYSDQYQQQIQNNSKPKQQQQQQQQQQQLNISAVKSNNNNMPSKSVNEYQKPSQMDDLKIRGGYLKKLLQMFDENTEDLINKMSSFKDGLNEDEEDEQDEENIEKVLKEQINSSKSRPLNFYSNIQIQDKGYAWVNEGSE